MTDEAKRETLTLLGAGAAGLMVAGMAEAQNKAATRAEVRGSLKGGREPKPLPFDAGKLNGLSENTTLTGPYLRRASEARYLRAVS